MLTDDPTTVDKGKWELNVGFVAQHTTDEGIYEAPLVDLNYGLIDDVQLKFEIPLVIKHDHESTTIGGFGKSNVGIKWNFLDEKKSGVSVGMYPQLIFINSNRAIDRGLVEKGTEFHLPLSFQTTFDKNVLVMQLGRMFVKHDEGAWTYGLIYSRELSDGFDVSGEINGSANPSFDEIETFLNVGARVKLSEMFKLLVSAGRNLIVHPEAENTYIGYLGFQTVF